MSEVELLLPDGIDSERLAEALSTDGLTAEGDGSGRAHRTYYDTFDGRLRADGTPAVYEHGRLSLNGLSVPLGNAPEHMLASELQHGPLRDALASAVDVRALLRLAELDISERRLRILDAERKTVVRATIEAPALSRTGAVLSARLRLVALRGYDTELARIRSALARELALEPAPMPLVDEAVAALGGRPGGVSSKVAVKLWAVERADHAAATVLRRLLEVIEQNLDGAMSDLDSEFLHDLRVAVRRTRSVQRQLKGVFAPAELTRFRAEFRWVQAITADVRDLDVYLLDYDDMQALVPEPLRAELAPLHGVLVKRKAAARRRMRAALRSARFESLLRDWGGLLKRLTSTTEADRPDASRPIGPLAGERIAKLYRRMIREGEAIDERGGSEPFHELRKRGKELRYLLELFGAALYPADAVRPMIKTLKALQDVLGDHQDREVQSATLEELAGELAGSRGTLLAIGALIGRLDDEKRAARAAFTERFAPFASDEQRALVRDTFG